MGTKCAKEDGGKGCGGKKECDGGRAQGCGGGCR